MAFRLGPSYYMPDSAEGIYLLPYAWYKVGLERGYLIKQSLKFHDTIQGSIIDSIDELVQKDERYACAWWIYDPRNPGFISPCKAKGLKVYIPESKHLKLPISCNVNYLADYAFGATPNECKNLSHSMIQLFRGCHVKLNQSVWDISDEECGKLFFRYDVFATAQKRWVDFPVME